MAAQQRKTQPKLKNNSNVDERTKSKDGEQNPTETSEKNQLAEEHLPPLPLIFTVLACSGLLWVFAFRDVLATGKNIAGVWDEAMLFFTKSTQFFDGAKGWKSQQGGLSSIQQVTTDANNMGGLFVRKVGGAAVLAVHTQKLLPLLFHPSGAKWNMGHFRPLLRTAILGNLMSVTLYSLYMHDFNAAEADTFPKLFVGALLLESLVMLYYLVTQKTGARVPAVAMPPGKTPSSVVSRIVTRTVTIVSGTIAFIAARDLLFPGQIIDFIPRDDIYLEWTGAFLHSPPVGSEEAAEQGMEAPLYVGDKYLSQLMALHIIILCMYKFVSAYLIRNGSDLSGQIKCNMIWRAQSLGEALILFMFRLFAPAASSASLDLRWHLMMLAYETFILGLYSFF